MALTINELMRKLLHMSVGGIAFAMIYLGSLGSALCALTAVLFNVLVLPRIGGRKLWREAENDQGMSWGIVLYPTTVLILILIFWKRLEVAAAIWGILAFGDGMATVVGKAMGSRKLPWNPEKSWSGTLAYAVFGTAGAFVLLTWTAPGRYSWVFALTVTAVTAVVAAGAESLPQGLDDNVGVPLLAGAFLYALLFTEGHWATLVNETFLQGLLVGAIVNTVLAVLGYWARGVNFSGMVAGFILGTTMWAFAGWQGYLLLLTFFILGTALTKLGYQKKVERELAQEGGGRRGARHALANTGTATFCALLVATTDQSLLFALGLAGAFATAAADTAGSEIGQLWGRRTFLITTLKGVPRGTQGAISLEGTAASLVAAAVLAGLGAAVGLYPWLGSLLVTMAAFVGAILESLVGATLERRGLLDNEAVNFLNTVMGALLAIGLGSLFLA